MSPQLIFFLSNQHCGSSLSVNMFHRCGMSIGPHPMFLHSQKRPNGCYESMPFWQINQNLYRLIYGFTEDGIDYALAGQILKNREALLPDVSQLRKEWIDAGRNAIRSMIDFSPIVGVKHSATVLFWFYWNHELSLFPDIRTHLIFLLRPPSSIAASYARRADKPDIAPRLYDLIEVYFQKQFQIYTQWHGAKSLIRYTDAHYRCDMKASVEECGLRWNDAVFDEVFDSSATRSVEHEIAHPVQAAYEKCLTAFMSNRSELRKTTPVSASSTGILSLQRYCEPILVGTHTNVELLSQTPPQQDDANTHHRLGQNYGNNGQIEESQRHFNIAASLPGGKPVWKWKHLWYCPSVFENEAQIDTYWTKLNRDLDDALAEKPLYDWRTLPYDGFTHSFNLPHLNRCCKDVLEKFAQLFAPSFPFERPTYRPGKKIRVGFLVTPGHEGGFLRMLPALIDRLDTEKFEPIVIYNEKTQKRYENKFRRDGLLHITYPWNFEEAVRIIRAARCDILYFHKVGADVWNFFLPMCRLAPVQCTSWSTHGTSGVPAVDYYVSWNKAEITDAQTHYTERLFFLESKPYFERKLMDIPPPVSREKLGLPDKGALYFCPHRAPKYHPMFDDYLREILERDKTGYLVLLLGANHEMNTQLLQRMRRNIGVKNFERVIVLPKQHVSRYYQYFSVATVVLHSPIYAGEITAVDSFLYGTPSVTHRGDFLFQRYTSAFYDTFGLSELAVSSKEEYIAQSVKLGTDAAYRKWASDTILSHHAVFFENEQTVREWERFFLEVALPQNTFAVELQKQNNALVPMEKLEINVAYECNLGCRYCSHFCQWMSGRASTEQLLEWYETWNTKVTPKSIRLIGGEPLLHPDLDTIIVGTKKFWPHAGVELVTNGLLLPDNPDILHRMKEVDGHVFLSRHFTQPSYLRHFENVLNLLRNSGVKFTVYTSERRWRKCYEMDAMGRPIPYSSDAEKAWNNCHTKNVCPCLLDNHIFKCQHLAYAIRGARLGVLPKAWCHTLEYQPLSPESDATSIWTHLNGGAIPECRICPEQYEYVPLEEKNPRANRG